MINIDFNSSDGFFGTYAGMGAAPDADGGTIWNGLPIGPEADAPLVANFTSGPLITSTGESSLVTISVGNFKVYEADENPAASATALFTEFAYQEVAGTAGPNSTFSIRNLDQGLIYDLYLYSQNGGYGSASTIFTIESVSKLATNTATPGSFIENTNYVVYRGLTASVSGAISGTFNSAKAADNGAFNGLQIVRGAAPPPPPPPAAARTVNVDFNSTDGVIGTYSGTAVAESGATWNGARIGAEADAPLNPGFTSAPLLASDGSATAITFTLGNFRVYEADERPAAVATGLMTEFAYQEVVGQGGPNSTFSINNLDGAITYDLYLYSVNGGYGTSATIFTINGISKTAANFSNLGTFVEDANYVLFSGLTPDAGGSIFATFNSAKDMDNAAFNGFQLVQVPEPGSIALTVCAGFVLLQRRRRLSAPIAAASR